MSLTTRLLAALTDSAAALSERPDLAAAVGLHSLTLVGSLARDDFNEGGSDVDLLLVHGLDERPSSEIGRLPEVRAVLHLVGEPLLGLMRGAGRHRPFVIDCHFAAASLLARQPHWADPGCFLREHLARERYLWLYAFDLVEHGRTLWGDRPAETVRAYRPTAYLPLLVRQLREDLALAQSYPVTSDPSADLLHRWRELTGQILTLLALRFGGTSLRKREVYLAFNLRVPHFPGKDFAAALWAEYLYGTVFHRRDEWLRRGTRFCENGLKLLDQ